MSGVGVSVRAVFSSSVSRRGVGVGCSVLSFGAWRGVMSLSSFHAFSFSLPCVPHCLVSALFVYRRPVRRLVSSCRGASRVLRRLVVAFRSSWGVFVFHIRMRRFSQLNSPVGFSFVITEGGADGVFIRDARNEHGRGMGRKRGDGGGRAKGDSVRQMGMRYEAMRNETGDEQVRQRDAQREEQTRRTDETLPRRDGISKQATRRDGIRRKR